jgi:hypothetical protein
MVTDLTYIDCFFKIEYIWPQHLQAEMLRCYEAFIPTVHCISNALYMHYAVKWSVEANLPVKQKFQQQCLFIADKTSISNAESCSRANF